jgi:outer membrane cobalamin receptor
MYRQTIYMIHIIKGIFIYSLLLFSLKATAQGSSINGIVVDKETGTVIENAVVAIKGASISTMSDAFGGFTFKELLLSNYTIVVSHIGYTTCNYDMATNNQLLLKIELQKSKLSFNNITVSANKLNSYTKIAALDLLLRPIRTSQDALKIVPGLFIAQHAGGGKAEQIFLRGFDIDHGTDISIAVDGMPVNMISHAHGQGYADLHFLIPETIEKINFDKGPYNAEKGNLATAGFVDFKTKDFITSNTAKVEVGNFNTKRVYGAVKLFSNQNDVKTQQLYLATEYQKSDGYFESPQNFNRFNAMAKYSLLNKRDSKLNILLSTFQSKWNASGQIPERAVENGLIKRFGAIDDTEGGNTSRTNFSIQYSKKISSTINLEQQLFYNKYNFNLFSNFTFFLSDSINGDMINQKEERDIYGYSFKLKKQYYWGKYKSTIDIGTGFRYDDVSNIELSNTPQRTFKSYIQKGAIQETNFYSFINNYVELSTNFQATASIRYDYFNFGYKNNLDNATHFATQQKGVISPKLSLSYKFNNNASIFLGNGIGFHSNDTRVVLNKEATEILPKVYGTDLGITIKPNSRLFIKTTLWHLLSQQEFVYVGDAGIVEPSGKSRRLGIDLMTRYQVNRWLFGDLDFNLAKAKAIEQEKGQDYIPLAPSFTSTGGLVAKFNNTMSASLRYRYLANRPANEDYSVVAKGYFLADAVVNYKIKNIDFNLNIENLFNHKWKEAQFNTASKLLTETNPVSEIHYTPGSPFSIKLGMSVLF